jgi:hypothetical protein
MQRGSNRPAERFWLPMPIRKLADGQVTLHARGLRSSFGLVMIAACLCVHLAAIPLRAAKPSAEISSPEYKLYEAVKPILQHKCVACHGALRQEGDVRLDAGPVIAEQFATTVVVPGRPEDSRLWLAVNGAEGVSRMPEDGPPLSATELEAVRLWIADGARVPDEPVPSDPRQHWSFLPPVRPDMTSQTGRSHPIDELLGRAQRQAGVKPFPAADATVLVRRLYWDLVGTPPPADVARQYRDGISDDEYLRLVDRLLCDPRHGERWARHWMDVWRYSDWYGYQAELRNSARHMWRFRDWIVESLNADRPYAEMIELMVAADEVAPTDESALRATGFLARNYYKFNRDVWLDHTVEHTSKAFLGLTMNCARCHHHMYDPFSQQQYYELRAVFEPYQVRAERLPGQPNVELAGLSRVFDADLTAPTYLYVRGNEKQPVKDRPISATVPEFLTGRGLSIEPVSLPRESWYPGSRRFIGDEQLAEARQRAAAQEISEVTIAALEVEQQAATAALEPVSELPADALTPGGPHPAAIEFVFAAEKATHRLHVAQRKRTAALQQQTAVEARLTADAATAAVTVAATADQGAPSADLAHAAVMAERQADVSAAAAALAEAKLQLTESWFHHLPRRAKPPTEMPAGTTVAAPSTATAASPAPVPIEKAMQSVAEARARVQQAEQSLNAAREQRSTAYTAFSEKYPTTSTGRRRAFARWVSDPRNPLTARVAVNHVWLRHFGQPLVDSVFDFGLHGSAPAVPELLDWLAVEFVESGWSFRHLHRVIVTSEAYRRSSSWASIADIPMTSSASATQITSLADTTPTPPTLDRENRWWGRYPERQLEAEAVRDGVLYVSNAANEIMGGPELDPSEGLTNYRRSLYFRHAPEKSMVFLQLFDAPSPNECYRRERTIVPQQALALVNSELSSQLSEQLATIVMNNSEMVSAGAPPIVEFCFWQILSRPPSEAEWTLSSEFLAAETSRLSQLDPSVSPDAARQKACAGLIQVLWNHHEFVTVR